MLRFEDIELANDACDDGVRFGLERRPKMKH